MAKKKVKAVQTAIPRAKQEKVKKSSAKFVSLTVRAVIPTQSFGNIQPEIAVTANTFEEARSFAMPYIEEMYKHYCEGKPAFLGKITETVKEVAPAAPAPVPTQAPAETVAVEAAPAAPKPEAVLKAEKAISLAATEQAATLIQDQIEKSVKIPQEFKQDLLTLCLKKRKELETK